MTFAGGRPAAARRRFGRAARTLVLAIVALLPAAAGCHRAAGTPHRGAEDRPQWALAIHGGAGTPDREMPEADRSAYLAALENALRVGSEILDGGGSGLDAVEQVIRLLEDDPLFNAGHGAVFTADGGHELDSSIMDGATLACGGVGAVRTVKNPVSLARLVMDRTRHVLLVGDGAEKFATEMGVERVEPVALDTDLRREALRRYLEQKKKEASSSREHGTVGAVALDRNGNLAAATSTGGLTGKMAGRVGDSPIIGAGTYADNRTCAVSGTGVGEEFIRYGIARRIGTLMEYEGVSLAEASRQVVHHTLREGEGGIVAVGRDGSIAMEYNTVGMYRGAADSTGRFETHIWE